jgi:excisionase family DNA binding protein
MKFGKRLSARHLKLVEGLEVVRQWIFYLRRLLIAMGATHYLPHPDGNFPSPWFPTPRPSNATTNNQQDAEARTPSSLAGHGARDELLGQVLASERAARGTQIERPESREFYSVAQAATRFGVSTATVYGLVAGSKLKHSRVGVRRGVIRISEEQLAEYLRISGAQLIAPASSPQLHLRHLNLP